MIACRCSSTVSRTARWTRPTGPSSRQISASSSFESGPELCRRAVGQHDLDGPHVIDRLAVAERPGTRRVVADHAADRGPVAGRDVRPEHQPQRLEVGVELVEHDARLDPHRHRIAIDDADPVKILREVDDDPRPDGLAREAGGPAPRHDRHALLGRDPHRRDHILDRPGHDHAHRLDLVQAGVGRVKPAPAPVEVDLGAGLLGQAVMKAGEGRGWDLGRGGHRLLLVQRSTCFGDPSDDPWSLGIILEEGRER